MAIASQTMFAGQIEGNIDMSIFNDNIGDFTEMWSWCVEVYRDKVLPCILSISCDMTTL